MGEESANAKVSRARIATVVVTCFALFGAIAGAFWYWDMRYSAPTPRPADLVQAPLGTELPVDAWLAKAGVDRAGRPVHFHFFNPTCPCSRFNLDHLHKLVEKFHDRITFVAVVESELAETEAGRRELAFVSDELRIQWIADEGGRIAAAAGIYSTPQAVITTSDGSLYYRGNYNASRYCTDPRTEYARQAIEALLAQEPAAAQPRASQTQPAYGCELPAELAKR